jgi:hypothetical protein
MAIYGGIKSEGQDKKQGKLRIMAMVGDARRGPVPYYGSGG